jgi:phosphatidylethanolamine/phosphatidyl-N-methylethanolamine N-methyltransferase
MPTLDPEFGNQDHFYQHFYSKTIGQKAGGLRSVLWKYPHRLIERKFRTNSNKAILEVGAGNGEHLPFVTSNFDSYTALDLRISPELDSLASAKVKSIQGDVTSLQGHNDSFYDRIVATCLLAHLRDPERALSEMRRVAKPDGVIQIYLPCEPGLLLALFRSIVTAPAVRRLGFKGFDLFMAREHRNSLPNLLTQVKYIFSVDEIQVLRRPFPGLWWFLNLFFLVEIRVKK